MMKKLLFSLVLFASFTAFSQVGINVPSLNATLDITAKNPTGVSGNVDGLLVPRVDRQRAQSMTGIPVSTMIYVNNIATGTQAGTAVNIDAVGYYYFNEANVWTKLKGADGSATDTNIYNVDGTLTGNRMVSQEDKTLAFTSTATSGTNQFSVDGSTLSVDAVNNRVGMGTTTPQKSLHVSGTMQLTNEFNVGGNATLAGNPGIAGQALTSGGAGASTAWSTLPNFPLNVLTAKFTIYTTNQSGEFFPTLVTSKLDTNYLQNAGNGRINILKAGYYQILATTTYNIISTIAGTVNSRIYKNYVSSASNTILGMSSTTYAASTPNAYHALFGAAYLNAGDFIMVGQSSPNGSIVFRPGDFTSLVFNYLGQ